MALFKPKHNHYTYEGVRFTFRTHILNRDIADIAANRTIAPQADLMMQDYESATVRALVEEIHVHETDTHYFSDDITDELWGEIPYQVIATIFQQIGNSQLPLVLNNEPRKPNEDTEED